MTDEKTQQPLGVASDLNAELGMRIAMSADIIKDDSLLDNKPFGWLVEHKDIKSNGFLRDELAVSGWRKSGARITPLYKKKGDGDETS